jgi:hypothetical protein
MENKQKVHLECHTSELKNPIKEEKSILNAVKKKN